MNFFFKRMFLAQLDILKTCTCPGERPFCVMENYIENPPHNLACYKGAKYFAHSWPGG